MVDGVSPIRYSAPVGFTSVWSLRILLSPGRHWVFPSVLISATSCLLRSLREPFSWATSPGHLPHSTSGYIVFYRSTWSERSILHSTTLEPPHVSDFNRFTNLNGFDLTNRGLNSFLPTLAVFGISFTSLLSKCIWWLNVPGRVAPGHGKRVGVGLCFGGY